MLKDNWNGDYTDEEPTKMCKKSDSFCINVEDARRKESFRGLQINKIGIYGANDILQISKCRFLASVFW